MTSFIDWSLEHEITVPFTRVDTRYSEVVTDVTEDMQQRALSKDELGSLERRVKKLQNMLVATLDEHSDSGLYTLK